MRSFSPDTDRSRKIILKISSNSKETEIERNKIKLDHIKKREIEYERNFRFIKSTCGTYSSKTRTARMNLKEVRDLKRILENKGISLNQSHS